MTNNDRGTVQVWLGLTFLIVGVYGIYSGEILALSKARPAVVTFASHPFAYVVSEAAFLGLGAVILRLGWKTKSDSDVGRPN